MHIHSSITQKKEQVQRIKLIIYSFRFIAQQKKHKTYHTQKSSEEKNFAFRLKMNRNLVTAFFNDDLRLKINRHI